MMRECADCRTLRDLSEDVCPLCTRTLSSVLCGEDEVLEPESGVPWKTLFFRMKQAYIDVVAQLDPLLKRCD